MRLADKLELMEQDVRLWAKNTRTQLLFRLAGMGVKDRSKLIKASKIRFKKTSSGRHLAEKEDHLYPSVGTKLIKTRYDLEGVAFTFARHGIFLEHGVGKYRKIGSTASRYNARPWLEPVLNMSIDKLADLLEENYADIAASNLVMSIPGVIKTSIHGAGPNRTKFLESKSSNASEIDKFLAAMNEDIREMQNRGASRNYK